MAKYFTKGILSTSMVSAALMLGQAAGAVEVARLPALDGSASPGGPTCVTGSYLTKYISTRPRKRVDHSYTRFTWQPRFCRQGNVWQPSGEPRMESLSAGSLQGVGIDLQAPKLGANYMEYRGRVRACLPLGAGYKGLEYSGTACYTAGNVTIRAEVRGNTVRYSLKVTTTKSGRKDFYTNLEWTDRVV